MSKKLNKKSDPASKTTEKSSKRVTRRNVIKDTEESPKVRIVEVIHMIIRQKLFLVQIFLYL